MAIEDEVLSRITPTPEQRRAVDEAVASLLDRTKARASEKRADLEVMVVGSVAKDTFVQDPDIDIFVLFPTTVERHELERIGLEIGREVLGDGEERYAEHPYTHGTWGGLEVDLVPCYHISDPSQLRSAVDRTPFHTRYIKSNLKQGQHDDVRLLKQFMKGVGTYGAEAKVQGFSGYLVELLVIRYGTFRGVLQAAAGWKPGIVLSLGEKGRRFEEPFVFYDPVDKDRNVASALSLDSLARFIYAAQEYLRSPSVRFFFPRPRTPLTVDEMRGMVKARGTAVLVVRLDRPALTDDNLYPQLRRTLDGAVDLLERGGFKVYDRAFHADETLWLIIELESSTLPRAVRRDGPPAWIANARSFLDKWTGRGLSEPFLDNGRWKVFVEREHTEAARLIEDRLASAALGSDLRGLAGLSARAGEEAIDETSRGAVSALLDKRKNWDV